MKYFSFLFLNIFLTFCNLTKDQYPDLTGPVIDPSGFLPNEKKQSLEKRLLEEENRTTNQVVIYITDSLNKNSVEEEALAVFEKWQLGTKEKDNGVLFLLAPNDRKVRIEVGYGLEGILTDVLAKRIIEEIIVPNMKSGNSTDAIVLGTNAILDQLNSGSSSFLETNCPNDFSDLGGDLHPDTIPLLKKETRSLSNLYVQFCVLPTDTIWALEATAAKLLLNDTNKKKNKVVFVVSPKNEFMGTILVSPELRWSISKNKVHTIFNRRHKEKYKADFTNYSYLAFLEMLNYLKHPNKQLIEKGSGVFDPHDVLESFSYDRSREKIKNIEQDHKIKTQILFLDTDSNLKKEAKKFHILAFGNSPAITLLFSLNQKEIYLYTDENSFQHFHTKLSGKENELLDSKIRYEIESELKIGDIDWMCIRATETIDYFLFNLSKTEKSEPLKVADEPVIQEQPHFLWDIYFALSFLIGFLALLGGEGFLFFNSLFFILFQKFKSQFPYFYDSPNLYQTTALFTSIFSAQIIVMLFRKIGWAGKIHNSIVTNVTYGSYENSGNGSSSGSGYRSSSSSYSGGGGRSGGGGASGSW